MAELEPIHKEIGTAGHLPMEFEESDNAPKSWKRPRISTVVLSLTTVTVGLLSLYLSLQLRRDCRLETFRNGYSTEWTPVKESIDLQKVTYSSAFRYNQTSKTYYRAFDPKKPQYVGPPTADIDQAWGDLLTGQYLVITADEAKHLENPVAIRGYYLAEVEVPHSLHCLNAVRKALHKDYYMTFDKHWLPREVQDIHIEHCIDQLRQAIQCSGDLTPVPLRPYGD